MGSRRIVGFALATCGLAGLLAASAACGAEHEPSSGDEGNARGAESAGGQGGAGRDAAVGSTQKDAATGSTRRDATQSGEPDTAVAEPDAGADPDAASRPDPELDASVPTTCELECAAGERCALVEVTCIRAPCPPVPSCVKIEPVSCDPRLILCRRAPPECPQWHVPSVSGSCFGPCVPVEQCACDEPADCPDPDHYTCHRSAAHCGPYVQ